MTEECGDSHCEYCIEAMIKQIIDRLCQSEEYLLMAEMDLDEFMISFDHPIFAGDRTIQLRKIFESLIWYIICCPTGNIYCNIIYSQKDSDLTMGALRHFFNLEFGPLGYDFDAIIESRQPDHIFEEIIDG